MNRMIMLAAMVGSVSFIGCVTPGPVVRLHPAASDVIWHSGRAIVTRQVGDLRVAVAFERMEEGRLAFRVEAQNHGSGTLDIGPHQMSYRTCRPPAPCGPRTPVVDPEETLVALDVARSRERASQTNEAGFGAALLMLNLVATVGAAANGNSEQAADLATNGMLLADSTASSIERHENTIRVLDAQKINWAAASLRRTTLFPGQGIAGLVQVPLDPRATRVWLRVRSDDPDLWFEFEQVLVGASAAPAAPPFGKGIRGSPHQ